MDEREFKCIYLIALVHYFGRIALLVSKGKSLITLCDFLRNSLVFSQNVESGSRVLILKTKKVL